MLSIVLICLNVLYFKYLQCGQSMLQMACNVDSSPPEHASSAAAQRRSIGNTNEIEIDDISNRPR